jgi:hypothetical protein
MDNSETNNEVIAQEINQGIYTLDLLSNGIVKVVFDSNLNQIEKEHLVALKESLGKLGKGKKLRIYFNVAAFLNISPEGREYSATTDASEFTLCNAILVDSLAKKIAFNFFLNINKPLTPTKAFGKEEEAFEWLLSLKG